MTPTNGADGYVTDAAYTLNYFNELNPARAAFCLLLEGIEPPPEGPACELGYGQGVSLAMHAAGDVTRRWWGTDVIASHARHARDLIAATGVQAEVADQSFAEFCARDDLPSFAFIGLHGVWSWVSEANRALIVDFLRRKLMPGGVAYISYNALAGWAPILPLRQLLVDHAQHAGSPGAGPLVHAREAQVFAERVFALGGQTVQTTPALRSHLSKPEMSPDYLLHEYMNRDWTPMAFSQVAGQLQAVQLGWAGSTQLLNRMTDIYLSAEQQQLMASTTSPVLRETLRDLFTGQQLRRDLWVRGLRRLTPAEQRARLLETHVVAVTDPAGWGRPIVGPLGEARLPPDRLRWLAEVLGGTSGAMALGEVARRLAAHGVDPGETIGLVSTLVGSQAIHVALDAARTAQSRPATDRLNAALLKRSATRGDIGVLACPVTGGAVGVPATTQQVLHARRIAPDRAQDWPAELWQRMRENGRQIQRAEGPVTDRAVALPLLEQMVKDVCEKSLPALQRLQVVG